MNAYQLASVLLALVLYLPLGISILKGKVKQNLATFILWGLLDGIAGLSIYVQGGNFQLPFAYVAGCSFIIGCILTSRLFQWTRFETYVSVLVGLSVLSWTFSGPWMATIFSTTGTVLAGIPQIRDSWKDPGKSPVYIYVGYGVANTLATFGGKSWVVEERLFPAACAVLCFVLVVVSMRQYIQRDTRFPTDRDEILTVD